MSGQSRIAFERMKRALATVDRSLWKPNDTDRTIEILGAGKMWFKSGEVPDNLYGDDVYAAVIDEASRLREESYFAIRSTITATRGQTRIIGNVKGKQNWFYKMCRKAEAGRSDWHYSKLTAYDAVEGGILYLDEIEDAKSELPENVFNELYMAEPADDGGNPFGIAAIQACIAPMSTDPAKCWGWDLAKSYDWTVGVGLDRDGAVCKFERWQAPWEVTIPKIISITDAQGLLDSTGVGDPIDERVRRETNGVVTGFKFTPQSKQQIMEGLAVSIQQGIISFPEGPIVSELEMFEYEYTRTGVRYSAPAGVHDDCVCALALANKLYAVPERDWLVLD